MGDMKEAFDDLKDLRAQERAVFGVKCPVCINKLPKASPKILLPGQICRAHKPNYTDVRIKPTDAEWEKAMNGWKRITHD